MKTNLFFLSFLTLISFSFVSSVEHKTSEDHFSAGSGIKFSKISFDKALKQASSSKKLIFIDVHTSWCGPCKEMAATTFKDAEVGKEFNERFINLKIDAEEDADGPRISKKYGVTAYPTLLFVDGSGKLVKKLIGKQTKEKLLNQIAGL